MVIFLLACGPTPCEALCAERAACVAETIAENDATWLEWTGYADEAAYGAACAAQFEADEEPPEDFCTDAEACPPTG